MMCICCDKTIPLLMKSEEDEEKLIFIKKKRQIKGTFDEEMVSGAESNMWCNGVIGLISGNYGSGHDGDEFIIAVCDDCITKKKMTGNIAFIDNYMGGVTDPMLKDDYEKSRIAWRRYNRIDDLLNGE